MDIFVNGLLITIPDREYLTIKELIEQLDTFQSGTVGLAIAVNETLVPKSSWDSFMIRPNARVELVRPMQGG